MYASHVILVRVVQVAAQQRNQEPNDRKRRPRYEKAQEENDQIPAPLQINERGEQVGEIATPTLVYVATRYVYVAILEEEALLLLLFDHGRVERRRAFEAERARGRQRMLGQRSVEHVLAAHDSHGLGAMCCHSFA